MGHTRDHWTYSTYQDMWGLGGTYQDLWDLVGCTRTFGTRSDIPIPLGLGGTFQDMWGLVGHTRTCRTWWDIPGPAGLGGTCQDLRDLMGHFSRPCIEYNGLLIHIINDMWQKFLVNYNRATDDSLNIPRVNTILLYTCSYFKWRWRSGDLTVSACFLSCYFVKWVKSSMLVA